MKDQELLKYWGEWPSEWKLCDRNGNFPVRTPLGRCSASLMDPNSIECSWWPLGWKFIETRWLILGEQDCQLKAVMRCAIWYHLYNLKNVKNTYGGVLLFFEKNSEICNIDNMAALHLKILLSHCFSTFSFSINYNFVHT